VLCETNKIDGAIGRDCRPYTRNFCQVPIQVNTLLNQAIADASSRVKFEFFTVVTMKSAVIWDVMLYGSCEDRHFGGT
jgi:hypothetical protein